MFKQTTLNVKNTFFKRCFYGKSPTYTIVIGKNVTQFSTYLENFRNVKWMEQSKMMNKYTLLRSTLGQN